MKKIDEYGDVQKVSMSSTTSNGLFELMNINNDAYTWTSIVVMRMYRFGDEPTAEEIEAEFAKYKSPILNAFIRTILEDARQWSVQGRAGIACGRKGGKVSATKRKTATAEISDIDLKAQKAAKALAQKAI